VADYAVVSTHWQLSAWNPKPLYDIFLYGVSEEVKDELTAREQPTELDSLIALNIRIDG
jgi:hypothetical protein